MEKFLLTMENKQMSQIFMVLLIFRALILKKTLILLVFLLAIGDILDGKLELTPVAIEAGKLLARRLYGGSQLKVDYTNVPTTVFTPLEYGACGLAEEVAISQFGEDALEVYISNITPLEWTVPHRSVNACYVKLVCLKTENVS